MRREREKEERATTELNGEEKDADLKTLPTMLTSAVMGLRSNCCISHHTNNAAQAATEVTRAFASASSSTEQGLESATKILKNPDTFSGEEPLLFPSWKLQFETWPSFGDSEIRTVHRTFCKDRAEQLGM